MGKNFPWEPLVLEDSQTIKTRLLQHRKYISIFKMCNKCTVKCLNPAAFVHAKPSSNGNWIPNQPRQNLAKYYLLSGTLAACVKHKVYSGEGQAELVATNPGITFWNISGLSDCPVRWLFYLTCQSATEALLLNNWSSPKHVCDKLLGPSSVLIGYVTRHDFSSCSASWKGRSMFWRFLIWLTL